MFLEVFTYGNGEMMSDILNGIAALFNDGGYKSFISIGVCCAFATLLLTTAFDLKLTKAAKWYAMVMMLYTAMIVPKAEVMITDLVVRNTPREVDNVPIGLAYVLSVLTTIEYQLTRAMETVFHVPDDVSYNQTGMMMASDMVRKAASFKIQDVDFSSNIKSFIQQCIQYDILHGKYTVNELFHAPNIWEFAVEHSSLARAFMYDGEIKACRRGAADLSQKWHEEIQHDLKTFGTRMFGNRTAQRPEELFSNYLSASYQHLADLSSNASDIMQQTMMINAYHDAVINNAAELGAAAAVESYAVAKATQSSRSAYKVSGEVAGRLLPYIKNTIQLLLVGAFIVILPLFFLISGVMRIKHYVEVLASLSLWGPLYAILNMQMTGAGRWKIIGLATQGSSGKQSAITIANLPGIEQIAADQSILAGYLALSIPLIAYGLIKSSMYAFTSLASGMMGVAQSSVGTVAEEAATGNYSLGNISLDNTNLHNTSSFQDETTTQISSEAIRVTDLDGTEYTHHANNAVSIDQQGGSSNLLTSFNLGSETGKYLDQSFQSNLLSIQSERAEFNESKSSSYRGAYELATLTGNSTESEASKSMGFKQETVQALHEFKEMIDTYAEKNGFTLDQTFAAFASANLGLNPAFKGLTLGAELGINATTESGTHHEQNHQQENIVGAEMVQSANHAVTVASDKSLRTGESDATHISDTIGANMERAKKLEESLESRYEEANQYQQALSHVKKDTVSMNMKGDQLLVDEMMKMENPDTGRPYTPHEISDLDRTNQLQERGQPIIQKYAAGIVAAEDEIEKKRDTIRPEFETNKAELKNKENVIPSDHQNNVDDIKSKGKLREVDRSIGKEVGQRLKDGQNDIAAVQSPFDQQRQKMKDKFDKSIGQSLPLTTLKAAGGSVMNTLAGTANSDGGNKKED